MAPPDPIPAVSAAAAPPADAPVRPVATASREGHLPVVPRSLLFSAVRNEGPFLLEWIAYHRVIGFDRIFIVSNDCTDGTDLLLDALAAARVIEHASGTVPPGTSPQASAAKRARRRGLPEAGVWALWLDADEFLNVHVGDGGLSVLTEEVGERQGALIPWRLFGDGGNPQFPGRFISQKFTGAAAAACPDNLSVKSLFRMGPGIVGFAKFGIHRPHLRKGNGFTAARFCDGNGRPLDPEREINMRWLAGRDVGGTCFIGESEFGWSLAQINHYAVRTPEFFQLKRLRGRGWSRKIDNNRHSDAFHARMNRNEEEDRSILRHEAAVTAEIEWLRALPGVAEAEAEVARRVAAQLGELEREPMPGADTASGAGQAPPLPTRDESGADDAGARSTPATGTTLQRPQLTFPDEVAERVRAGYAAAATILEYGSGGSTVLAAELPGKVVFSVESDAGWCAMMQAWFDANPGRSPVTLHHADIGPTRRWGRPRGHEGLARWPSYPLSVWERADFCHPDLVLIDGRFRAACFFTTLLRINRPVTVLWDDYADRAEYHHVEAFAAPVAMVGRMAEFRLEPRQLAGPELGAVVAAFLDPR